MRVLVSAAGRHGATREIAGAIADTLTGEGLEVEVLPPDQVSDPAGFDALILGSAVYLGRWTATARELVDRLSGQLAGRPVWLFSSGPVGDPPVPDPESAVDVSALLRATGARGYRLFRGRLERKQLGFAERTLVAALRVADGDYRRWDEVAAWARDIAKELLQSRADMGPTDQEAHR